jgi:diguanylate cyclase
MDFIVIDLLYGLATATTGAAAAGWLCWSHFRRKTLTQGRAEGRHAAEVLACLHELATRVAVAVDEHSSQVEEINDSLSSTGGHEPARIVDVVARLIQTNQRMQEKLASTEDKLRDQAQQIQVHAAEARTDALTLLANRRAFDDELARRIAEFRRQHRTFSLIMADVDRFKNFNDMHGHQTGDEVLRGVARQLRRKMREMDLVARYGGEEFAVILPGTNLDDASKAALRACQAVEKFPFRHDEKELRVTVSFGLAEVLGNEDGVMLVARADKALYAAKEGGRNCAYRHDGDAVHRVSGNNDRTLPEAKSPQRSGPSPCEPEGDEIARSTLDAEAAAPKPDSRSAVALNAIPGLPCRSTFCQQVRSRTAEWKRGGPTFSVVLMEVNQFDQGGADQGRQTREFALQVATRLFAATIREMDTVGHYAPGCFALLLPTAGLADAIRVAERLREGFSQCSLSAQGSQARLTLSVGVVQVTQRDDSISLLKRAEAALDAADRRGGDRAYYHDGDRCAPITAMLETMDYLA